MLCLDQLGLHSAALHCPDRWDSLRVPAMLSADREGCLLMLLMRQLILLLQLLAAALKQVPVLVLL